jgi:hypothetical protein
MIATMIPYIPSTWPITIGMEDFMIIYGLVILRAMMADEALYMAYEAPRLEKMRADTTPKQPNMYWWS